jgi:cytosine/adenosine deaminase-related metal-dependent hydrolase
MDLGRSRGGLPPDSVVEDRDAALAATAEAVDRYHDSSFGSMLRVAVAPCSPFSVTGELMREAAALARSRGVRLHTHLAETAEEEHYCRETFGCSPAEYVEELGWLADDVWLAHCVHLDDKTVARFADTGTSVAHCPTSNARLGAGIAPVRGLLDAGVPVGLGVDGSASNEECAMAAELHAALVVARLAGGPAALTARQALAAGTIGGARCLGRADEIGSLEPGKLADVALWRMDGLPHAGIDDPVAALVLGARPPLRMLLVDGRVVVEDGELRTADEAALAGDAARQARRLLGRVGHGGAR